MLGGLGNARRFSILVILTALVLPLGVATPKASPDLACPGVKDIAGVGPACLREGGLLEVFSPDGRSLGFTHGPDQVEGDPGIESSSGAPISPHCVTPSGSEYYIQVFYARAFNDLDRYATAKWSIRSRVEAASGIVEESAQLTGGSRRLRVACDSDGLVSVINAVLDTPAASASFSTIVGDLQQLGYSNARVKHWIFYDDPAACSCAGIANVYGDDRPIVGNSNNGNAGPMYAADFTLTAHVLLHELGHNLGAVQNSAPHSSLGFHCWDGADVMCYRDSGALGALYTALHCAGDPWDCKNNDYFHASPAAGSYLATHWNIAAPYVRFLQAPAASIPRLDVFDCSARSELGSPATCTLAATDDSTGVYYTLDWGDGTTTRVPATGTVAPGVTQSATHFYNQVGTYRIIARATDNANPAQSGPARFDETYIFLDNGAPIVAWVSPIPFKLYDGCAAALPYTESSRQYFDTGCIVVTAFDGESSIASITAYYDGVSLGTLTELGYLWEFDVTGPREDVPIRVVATDLYGNQAEINAVVDVLG